MNQQHNIIDLTSAEGILNQRFIQIQTQCLHRHCYKGMTEQGH
jgi:hypothetical protein